MNEPDQLDLFAAAKATARDGYNRWHRQRARARAAMADKLCLPLGLEVEIRLYDGVVLRGELKLKEELLFLEALGPEEIELRIGKATFRQSEIESCLILN